MSCPGGVVSVGDSRLDLLGKCGAPTFVEARPAQVTEWVGDRVQGASRTVTITVETWTYDLGSSRLVQYVRLEAGKVVNVRTGGYGHAAGGRAAAASAVPRAACEPTVHPGRRLHLRAALPLRRAGLPGRARGADRRGRGRRAVGGRGATTVVVKETWTYDFGPRALVRFVHGPRRPGHRGPDRGLRLLGVNRRREVATPIPACYETYAMSEIVKVTLPDGTQKEAARGTRVVDFVREKIGAGPGQGRLRGPARRRAGGPLPRRSTATSGSRW